MKRLIFLCFLGLWGITPLFAGIADEGVRSISLHDRICIRKFFDFAIKFDQAAHVLCFENKPVCFTGIFLKDKYLQYESIQYLKGWNAFKKNEHLFPHPNFIFCEELREKDDYKVLEIYLINKSAAEKCLQAHMELFRSILGPEFSPEKFMFQLESGAKFTDLIDHNDILLGVLLGFGVESSKAYAHVQAIQDYTWTDTYCGIEARRVKGCKIYPVAFMGNPSSQEVELLLSGYDTELEEIWTDYQKKHNSLLFFLDHLCRNSSTQQ